MKPGGFHISGVKALEVQLQQQLRRKCLELRLRPRLSAPMELSSKRMGPEMAQQAKLVVLRCRKEYGAAPRTKTGVLSRSETEHDVAPLAQHAGEIIDSNESGHWQAGRGADFPRPVP
eukprot:CAMPEP_0113719822 /NCGR_PEP_ID=MMETSP0038_2-20120614/36075_1 /TAXON_ID=2898 /ORGANISM="Cryptomonas paramecium" /LENGTH=117 /DNA_ID=CAMNT_0000648331 /DNA_START=239 /DNA_END=588 /DNA_ORIENTATION=+ /assembly_acc=CAM_ASM_000170